VTYRALPDPSWPPPWADCVLLAAAVTLIVVGGYLMVAALFRRTP
jgi:hypothetical protein